METITFAYRTLFAFHPVVEYNYPRIRGTLQNEQRWYRPCVAKPRCPRGPTRPTPGVAPQPAWRQSREQSSEYSVRVSLPSVVEPLEPWEETMKPSRRQFLQGSSALLGASSLLPSAREPRPAAKPKGVVKTTPTPSASNPSLRMSAPYLCAQGVWILMEREASVVSQKCTDKSGQPWPEFRQPFWSRRKASVFDCGQPSNV